MLKKLSYYQAIATLTGTIIGAGILAVPYVFMQNGFWTGTLVLICVWLAMLSIKLMVGEITLRTSGRHQLSGYVGIYLGKIWQKVIAIFISITIYGALLAYFVGQGETLSTIFGGSRIFWSLAFYFIFSLIIYKGIRLVKNIEFILSFFVLLFFLLIIFFLLGHFDSNNIHGFKINNLFVPFGVILFASVGTIAIPEMRKVLYQKEIFFKKAIIVGATIPAIINFTFALSVVGATGGATTTIATLGLGQKAGEIILILSNIFASLTMATCFLMSGIALKDEYNYDLKLSRPVAWLLTVLGPLALYLLGFHDFIKIISLIGAFGLSFEGLVYLATYWRARSLGQRQPEYFLGLSQAILATLFLSLVFLSALGYTIIMMI